MAVGAAAGLLVVVLVVVLGGPEGLVDGGVGGGDGCGGGDEGVDLVAAAAQQGHHFLGLALLQAGGEEDAAQVLGAEVRALSVELGGVVYLEEELAEFLVGCLCGVELYSDGFIVSGLVRLDFLVRGTAPVSADVSYCGGDDSRCLVHIVLDSPEAAGGEYRCFGGGLSVCQVEGVAAAALVELGLIVVEEPLDCHVVLKLGI